VIPWAATRHGRCNLRPVMTASASLSVMSPRRRATYQDVLDAPAHMVAQVINGELSLMPRPAAAHAVAASVLSADLMPPFSRGKGGPGGWILLFEPELHFGEPENEDILVPDLAGWRRERMPAVEPSAYFTLAPDWVCEVLSPRTAKMDRADKLPIYAREQVGHVWLVDPAARTLEVLRREATRWLLVGVWSDEARVRGEPFDAIELELGALWADMTAKPEATAGIGG
jgi:Uma2 family endonuclease